MSVVMGVRPGGRSHFAISAIFFNGRLPATLFSSRVYSSVQEVFDNLVGVYGEWGEISGVAVNAPLTWAAGLGGVRACDQQLLAHLPKWYPRRWIRAPNAIAGATTIQGPAFVWAMAREAKRGTIEQPEFYETNARASLARMASDLRDSVKHYRERSISPKTRKRHVHKLIERLADPGLIVIETDQPESADELESLVCALTALGCAHPESGLVIREFPGEEIRPVGKRSLCVVDALP